MSEREPLLIRATAVAMLQQLLVAVVLMGWWELTPEQSAAWGALVALTGTFAVAVWSRGKVTPVDDPRLLDDE